MYVLIYTIFYLSQRTDSNDFPYYFNIIFCEAVLGLLITHVMRYFLKAFNVLGFNISKQVVVMFFSTISFALCYNTLVIFIEQSMGWESQVYEGLSFVEKWFKTLTGSILFFIIWGLLYFAYHYVSNWQKHKMNEMRLENVVKELELKTIKAHINPHFIFNALNGIRALIDLDPEAARNAITQLSHLMRSTMNAGKQELVPLEQELGIIQNYLALEKIRFDERLSVITEIQEETLNNKVPPMMLQTLVENAIKHGISKLVKGGVITITSKIRDGYHEVIVKNTGTFSAVRNIEDGEGFGLTSTRSRLQLLFGRDAKFDIFENKADNEVVAMVLMPLSPESAAGINNKSTLEK